MERDIPTAEEAARAMDRLAKSLAALPPNIRRLVLEFHQAQCDYIEAFAARQGSNSCTYCSTRTIGPDSAPCPSCGRTWRPKEGDIDGR